MNIEPKILYIFFIFIIFINNLGFELNQKYQFRFVELGIIHVDQV